MEDEMDIQPPIDPQKKDTDMCEDSSDNPLMVNSEEAKQSDESSTPPPLYEDLLAVPAGESSSKETAVTYPDYLQSVPSFPWQPDEETVRANPIYPAPYLSGNTPDSVTYEQLIIGVYINIPRSPRLWVGDQLRMRWGYNTFYTTIPESKRRTGPRLIQYLNSERLGDYEDGVVEVRYEVVRRSRLIGVSETLKVTLIGDGKPRPRAPSRIRGIRRRKLRP
jgi:hypothetical protein